MRLIFRTFIKYCNRQTKSMASLFRMPKTDFTHQHSVTCVVTSNFFDVVVVVSLCPTQFATNKRFCIVLLSLFRWWWFFFLCPVACRLFAFVRWLGGGPSPTPLNQHFDKNPITRFMSRTLNQMQLKMQNETNRCHAQNKKLQIRFDSIYTFLWDVDILFLPSQSTIGLCFILTGFPSRRWHFTFSHCESCTYFFVFGVAVRWFSRRLFSHRKTDLKLHVSRSTRMRESERATEIERKRERDRKRWRDGEMER